LWRPELNQRALADRVPTEMPPPGEVPLPAPLGGTAVPAAKRGSRTSFLPFPSGASSSSMLPIPRPWRRSQSDRTREVEELASTNAEQIRLALPWADSARCAQTKGLSCWSTAVELPSAEPASVTVHTAAWERISVPALGASACHRFFKVHLRVPLHFATSKLSQMPTCQRPAPHEHRCGRCPCPRGEYPWNGPLVNPRPAGRCRRIIAGVCSP